LLKPAEPKTALNDPEEPVWPGTVPARTDRPCPYPHSQAGEPAAGGARPSGRLRGLRHDAADPRGVRRRV